ncbi:uncharacterized protein LOC127880234 [Dreissena polymorpha]|nr:uncharacterized protein LOC127880234 [Dreissena polymorpha]
MSMTSRLLIYKILQENVRQVSYPDVDVKTSSIRMTSTSVRITEMIVEMINPTTLNIDWCPVLKGDSLRGYKIRYAMKDISSYNEIFVTPGISNYTLSGLRPNTEYVISVNAVDENEVIIRNCGFGIHKTDVLEDESRRRHESPYVTAIAAVLLLLLALVVPITFLLVRKCEPCINTLRNTLSREKNHVGISNNSDPSNYVSDKPTSSFHVHIQQRLDTMRSTSVPNRRTHEIAMMDKP